ncbi:HLA class II histocompatibility antigen gamma chain isoform X1 [Manis pentadactyla]|uniref:HLA class II histocompatibility antigen gamma chain isoform X1 n=1 Tax=Manis pentadactyla TaxID=143292 RepID=UPI00255D0927|nr:HLA class II histocompatibility antigen gamma chain isoform X1 [Manis pentadactyla]
MEDQRDLISNHEQLPMLGQRPAAPESKCSRGALYTGFSVLVALLLAGQATTAYFLYQQQGRLDKLTVTSQSLQLESLRMKLPKSAKPFSKMRMATPMLMQALPLDGVAQGPMRSATKYGNMTQDHVMHLLLATDPLKVYPQLKGSFPENLKYLKSSMQSLDWKIFENWMHQWLLFEMSKNSLTEKPTEAPPKVLTKCQEEVSRIPAIHPGMFRPKCDEDGNYMPLQCYGSTGYCWCVFPNGTEVPHTRSRGRHDCSEPLEMEDLPSGLGMAKQDLGQAM